MPPETQGVVVVDGHRCESSWIANKVTCGRYGADFNTIQDAIDYCDAIGGEWVIELYPRGEAGAAVWNERDIEPDGGASITIKGMGEGRVRIAPTLAPTTAVIISAHTLNLEDIEVIAPTAAFPALRVTAGQFTTTECDFACTGLGDAIQQVGGRIDIYRSNINVGAVNLNTANCNFNLYHSNLYGGYINAIGVGLAHTIWVESCYLHNQDIAITATGATTCTVTNSTHLDTISNAGTGACYVNGTSVSYVAQTNAAGSITLYGGYLYQVMRGGGAVVWWLDAYTIRVLPSNTITDTMITWALAAAAAAGRRITIRLDSGDYEEDNMTLVDDVNIVGEGHTAASGSHITINSANPIFTAGAVQSSLRHLRITQAGAGAVFVINNAAAVVHTDSIVFGSTGGNAVTMTAGTYSCHHSTSNSGNYDLSTAACTLILHNGTISGGNIVTAGALAHTVDLNSVDISGGTITNGATGVGSTTTITIWSCYNVASFTDASQLGTVTIEDTVITSAVKSGTSPWTCRISDFGLLSNTNATGAITCYMGEVFAIVRAVGPIVWWQDTNTLKVIPSGTTTDTIITWAINAAAAGDVILIHPGTYEETVYCKAGVDLKGIGAKGSAVISQDTDTVVILASNIEIANLTVRLVTPPAAREIIRDGGTACLNVKLTDLVVEVTTPNDKVLYVFNFTAASNCTIERCSATIGGTGVSVMVKNSSAAGTFHLINNDFTLNNINGRHIRSDEAGTWTSKGNRWAGTCGMFLCTAGTFTFDHDAMICTGAWTNTGTTMTLRHCAIEAPVVAGDTAIVRLKNCSYRAISRSGTGNIVDESPELKDAPWHVEKWSWQAALANSQVAVRGTPVDGGSGQVLLEVNLQVADQEAVELLTEGATGARDNSFLPARTPRMIAQFLWDRSGANEFVFFGLRHTPGNTYPASPEHSAGFHYNSATGFIARSSDGAGDEDTVCTTPGHINPVQLEVIVFGVHSVEFYIDGVLVATHTTRVPSDTLDWQHLLYTDGDGGDTDVDVEVRNGGVQECPA